MSLASILEQEKKHLCRIGKQLLQIHGLLATQPWLSGLYEAAKNAYEVAEKRRIEMVNAQSLQPPLGASVELGKAIVTLQHTIAAYWLPSDAFRSSVIEQAKTILAPLGEGVKTGQLNEQHLDLVIALLDEIGSQESDESQSKGFDWLSCGAAFLAGGVTDWLALRGGYRRVLGLSSPTPQGGGA